MNSQKQKIKSAGWVKNMQPWFRTLADRIVRQQLLLAVRLGMSSEVVANNFALGSKHLSAGNFDDAIFRFRIVTRLDPKRAQAWYLLGNSYYYNDRRRQAVRAYRRALALNPDHAETLYMMTLAGDGEIQAGKPLAMPLSLVLAHFERLAESYDRDQLERYYYQGHTLMADAARTYRLPQKIDHTVLDMGAGTGLCGAAVRDIAAEVTAVDISERMLAKAAARMAGKKQAAYDFLLRRDIRDALPAMPDASYDLVLAGELLAYIGDCTALFGQVARVLRPGGLYIFTADIVEAEGFRFDAVSARFTYPEQYFRTLEARGGLQIMSLEKAPVYPDQSQWLGVMKKI